MFQDKGLNLHGEVMEMKPTNAFLSQMKLSLVLNQRKIFIYDDIDENSIFESIYYLYRLIDIDKIRNEKQPIEIYINSNGGSVYDCLTLVSLIQQMIDDGYAIRTINMGRAFSAGFLISIVGSERFAYRYSRYMIHDISTLLCGKTEDICKGLEETLELRKILEDIITTKTLITLDDLQNWYDRKLDKYFSCDEALKLSVVDKVL